MLKPWLILLLIAVTNTVNARPVVIGSKTFAESYVLAEAAAQLLEANDYQVTRRFGLNGTQIAYSALSNGAIDLYPEYSGTISQVILKESQASDFATLANGVSQLNLQLLPPLGFNNAYALAVSTRVKNQYQLSTISDLSGLTDLRVAFPHEFINRRDGWLGLQEVYDLSFSVEGIEHNLAYDAIASDRLDLIAVYTTDGQLANADLYVLQDNLGFFPDYKAAYLASQQLPDEAQALLEQLSGQISDQRMQQLNQGLNEQQFSYEFAASSLLAELNLLEQSSDNNTLRKRLWQDTRRHLKLTAIAVLAAMIVGIGTAVVIYRYRRLTDLFLSFTGLLQTVPSIALLALLIPLVGVGQLPAIIALFLYSLLPIARNTITALLAIPESYRQLGSTLAMTRYQELRHILLPLAAPHILAGIRTATVISIGTATLAAFIGAGGLGDPIVTGLALNDSKLILQGAIPAALLAILAELGFSAIERILIVPHMRGTTSR